MKLAVVTDSTAYLPERIKNHEDLFIIPIPVILDGKVYNEGIDIEADEYYALLKNSKEFPTTSQPVLGEVLALYESLKDRGPAHRRGDRRRSRRIRAEAGDRRAGREKPRRAADQRRRHGRADCRAGTCR